MTQRLANQPIASSNVPRDFDADLLRPAITTVDDLLDGPSNPRLRPQGRQGRVDADGWYTPPPTPPPLEDVRGDRAAGRPVLGALVIAAIAGAVVSGMLTAASPAAASDAALDPSAVAALVAEGYARLDVDASAAAASFRRALASDPSNGAALLGLGVAVLPSDRAAAASSLCAAAHRPGAVRLTALDVLDRAAIRCD